MREGWEIKKLHELCQIELGKTPYRGDKSYWDIEKETDNVWLSIADLLKTDGDEVSDSKEYISNKAAKISKVVKRGTLLLSFKLTLGRLAFAGRDLFTNEAIAALTIKNEKLIDKYFLYHFLSLFDWNAAAEGDVKVKGKTLNKAKLKEIEVCFPTSLPEQQRIVAILDEAFAAIAKAKANAEQNLKNAKELFESYLQGVFENKGEGWEEKKLGELYSFKNGINFDKTQKNGNGILTLDVLNMYCEGLKVDISKLYRIDKKVKEDCILKNEDILIVRSSVKEEGVAWATYFEEGDEQITYCGFIIRGRPFKELYAKYVVYFLRTEGVRSELIKKATKSTITNINQSNLSEIIIPIPPIKEQQTIVRQLDALKAETQKLEAVYQQKLADLEELKKSILQKAFAGELTEKSKAS